MNSKIAGFFTKCILWFGLFIASPSFAETVSISLPDLVGRYYDSQIVLDGGSPPYRQQVSIGWLDSFEQIEEVRIRVSGQLTPSKWQMFDNLPRSVLFNTADSELPVVGGTLYTDPSVLSSSRSPIDEWSELPGLQFILGVEGDWTRFLATSVAISRTSNGSLDVMDFQYDLLFDRFMVPNVDAIARSANALEFSVGSRFWTMDMSPKPSQATVGIVDIESARLIVTGTLGPGAAIPEPSSWLLVELAAAIAGLRTRPLRAVCKVSSRPAR